MTRLTMTGAAVLATVLAAPATAPAQTQTVTGPVATYWVSAQTSSGLPGMGAMGLGGGGFNPMALMSGGGVRKTLDLKLQSGRTTASPAAEHLPPQGLGVGSLPLTTPSRPGPPEERDGGPPQDYGAQGRLLIYHGCGEPTGPGQPVVIELSRTGVSELGRLGSIAGFSPASPPSPGPGRTYGDWPNGRDNQAIPSNGSLIGAHRVQGNYTPDIDFTLNESQDYLSALRVTGVGMGGDAGLGWDAVPNARGYFALTMGGAENGDVILWSSSAVAILPSAIPDYLAPADLNRLVDQGVILPASTTQCPIPSAVLAAAPESMLRLAAYGGEADFSYPPRPTDSREPWNIEYAVKVRYSSVTTAILGMDMSEFGEAAPDDDGSRGLPVPPNAGDVARSALRGLGALRRRH